MPPGKSSDGLDILGIKPIGESIKSVTESSLLAAGAFLGRICLPAAEEFGLLLRDRVGAWRQANAVRIALKAKTLVEGQSEQSAENMSGHPKLIIEALQSGSWTDNDLIQNMWAGLLATSCSPEGDDEGNLIFINLLGRLTSSEARILNHLCEQAPKYVLGNDLPWADAIRISPESLAEVSGVADIHRLDRELDHLRSEVMVGDDDDEEGGFLVGDTLEAVLRPTAQHWHYLSTYGLKDSWDHLLSTGGWRKEKSRTKRALIKWVFSRICG